MKATIRDLYTRGFNTNHRKENNFREEYAAIDRKTGNAHAVIRLYSTQSRSYACVWIRQPATKTQPDGVYRTGSGLAGGYGYHRPSAAAAVAINAAGFNLDNDIDGKGDAAIREALEAVARCLGMRNPIIHHAHA